MNEDIVEVHITKPLTSSIIVGMLDKYPNLERITCAPSVYGRTSQTYISALKQLDIGVEKKYNWGAKSRTDGLEFEIKKLYEDGLSAKEIAQKTGITLNRVYYLLRKCRVSVHNRKTKHDYDEVKRYKAEGLSAKEIAEKLEIPLRSVYYILNNR